MQSGATARDKPSVPKLRENQKRKAMKVTGKLIFKWWRFKITIEVNF